MTHKNNSQIKIKIWVMNVFLCFLIAHGCGGDLESNRSRKNKEAQEENDKKNQDIPSQDADQEIRGNSDDAKPSTDEKEADLVVDEGTLPNYLFKRADLEKLTKIVEPYRPVPSPNLSSVRSAASLAQFIESTVNDAMKLPEHSPGRKFKVSIIDSKVMNAFMTGDSRMGLHVGTIAKSDESEILAVICHEMAHSARNHVYQSTQDPEARIPSRLANRLDSYLRTQFNRTSGTYVHDEDVYSDLRKDWNEAISEVEETAKRAESEADLIGAKICGNMGMDVKLYHKSLISFLKKAGGSGRQLRLKDGSTFTNVSQKTIFNLLFPIIEHPSTEERDQQIARLKSLLRTPNSDGGKKLFKSWLEGAPEPLEEARGKGLGLRNDMVAGLSLRDEKTGEIIVLNEGQGGCSHGHWDTERLLQLP